MRRSVLLALLCIALGTAPARAIDRAPTAPSAPQLAQADAAEISFWESVRDSADAAELEAYLDAYPSGHFAPLARLRLKRLGGTPEAAPEDAAARQEAPAAVAEKAAEPAATTEFQDPVQACDRLAADPDDPDHIGVGVADRAVDSAQAIAACEAALRQAPDERRLQYQLARALAKEQRFEDARLWLEKAAAAGSTVSQLNLGYLYANGLGGTSDSDMALRWIRRAAEQGLARAENTLGFLYLSGQWVAQDDAAAAGWFERAAAQGLASAQVNLGSLYRNGRGVAQDEETALAWYRRAAEQGETSAMSQLRMHFAAIGDSERMLYWAQRGIEAGDPSAYYDLGMAYLRGIGVPKNETVAVKWLCEAAKVEAAANVLFGVAADELTAITDPPEGRNPASQEAVKAAHACLAAL